MSLEHSPARQRKLARKQDGTPSPFAYELLTREELAARLHVTTTTITRSWRRWGLRPVRLSAKLLFPVDQIAELEQRAMRGEVKG